MKKQLLSIASLLLLALGANAQITLSMSSYTTAPAPATDSFKTTVAATTYPSFAPATGAIWDVSTVTDSTANILVYRVPSTALSSTFADSSGYSIGGYTYQGNLLSAITSGGIMQYGLSTPGAAYSLSSVTSGPNDSLWIDNQVSQYSSLLTVIQFPATMSSSWSSNYMDSVDFTLTVLLASYTHAPGRVKSYVSRHDTVIGWGAMKVKTASGGTSGLMSVLQVRTQITRTDSFFINGVPATSTVLGALGITQGMVTKTYEQNFYRTNEISPLVNVQFSDSANTTPTRVTTHEQRLAPVKVINVANEANVRIYPNPVSNYAVSVDVPAATGDWKYELINVAGQVVAADALQLNGAHAQVQLSTQLNKGIYYIRILNDGKQVVVAPLELN